VDTRKMVSDVLECAVSHVVQYGGDNDEDQVLSRRLPNCRGVSRDSIAQRHSDELGLLSFFQ
jgi:hypothetical protein